MAGIKEGIWTAYCHHYSVWSDRCSVFTRVVVEGMATQTIAREAQTLAPLLGLPGKFYNLGVTNWFTWDSKIGKTSWSFLANLG